MQNAECRIENARAERSPLCILHSAFCIRSRREAMSVAPHEGAHEAHHPFLQHHFEDMGQQHEASTLGMWMFLATEILFFGGVLCAYWVYRVNYPDAWALGAAQQNWK